MATVVRKLASQLLTEPSGVVDQSSDRHRARISPGPSNRVSEGVINECALDSPCSSAINRPRHAITAFRYYFVLAAALNRVRINRSASLFS